MHGEQCCRVVQDGDLTCCERTERPYAIVDPGERGENVESPQGCIAGTQLVECSLRRHLLPPHVVDNLRGDRLVRRRGALSKGAGASSDAIA